MASSLLTNLLIIFGPTIMNNIVDSITRTVKLDEPGMGMGFVVSLDKLFGIAHMSCDYRSSLQENSKP